jgi:hypothetical protein
MSATKLVLHHRYRNELAYDWSRNNNHGHLVDVHTGVGSAAFPNVLLFHGGSSRVEVRRSSSLRDFGELRIRAVFRIEPEAPPRRYNLVEGELAFALFCEPDGSLHGTINSPIVSWTGPQSAPGIVTPNVWHTADYVHDGVSHARLFLDETLVADQWDEVGPIPNLASQGILIGYWPGGDDRYTLRGQLDEVLIWKDDPHRDAQRAIDECCLDKEWVDQRIDEARRNGWTGTKARETIGAFFDLCRSAVAEVRNGSPSQTKQMAALTQQGVSAIASRDASGLTAVLLSLQGILAHQLGPTRLQQLSQELWAALRGTPAGIWLRGSDEEIVAFLQEIARRSCLDGIVPPRPPERDPHRPEPRPDETFVGDPFTDRPPPPDPAPSGEVAEEPPAGQQGRKGGDS